MKVICGDRAAEALLYNGSEGELSLHKQHFYRGLANKQILDLGCGTGGAARYLQQFGNTVVGLTSSETEAVIARTIMTEVLVEDLDALQVMPFASGRFDVVLLGDILEHLKYPFSLLKALREVLKPDGSLYVSVPNVANVVVRLNLLVGRFEYEQAGIMDMTHLRFFTNATAKAMLEGAGFRIGRVSYSNWNWRVLPRELLRILRLRRVEQRLRNLLTALLPGLFATQIMLVATCERKDQS